MAIFRREFRTRRPCRRFTFQDRCGAHPIAWDDRSAVPVLRLTALPGRMFGSDRLTLKRQLGSQLDLPRAASQTTWKHVGQPCNVPEVGACVVSVRLTPLGCVHDAECLATNLQVPSFPDRKCAE